MTLAQELAEEAQRLDKALAVVRFSDILEDVGVVPVSQLHFFFHRCGSATRRCANSTRRRCRDAAEIQPRYGRDGRDGPRWAEIDRGAARPPRHVHHHVRRHVHDTPTTRLMTPVIRAPVKRGLARPPRGVCRDRRAGRQVGGGCGGLLRVRPHPQDWRRRHRAPLGDGRTGAFLDTSCGHLLDTS